MAEYLANIHGTERDKVNCAFYFKIGACRHGDRCSRRHVKPKLSQSVLIPNVYVNPGKDPCSNMNESELQTHFDLFYEDFYIELAKYGPLEEMHVCSNDGDHLSGNIYARFADQRDAAKCSVSLNNRYYNGRPLYAELSPVTDFTEACCRQNEQGTCARGGMCNFMHMKHPTTNLRLDLHDSQKLMIRKRRRH